MKYIKLFEGGRTFGETKQTFQTKPFEKQEVIDINLKLKDILQRLRDDGLSCVVSNDLFTIGGKTTLINIGIFTNKSSSWCIEEDKESIDEFILPVIDRYNIFAEEFQILFEKLKEISTIYSFDIDNGYVTINLAKKL